jgi:hypothetical protein
MAQPSVANRIHAHTRPPVAPLGKATVVALVGLPVLISSDLVVHGLTKPGLLFTSITLILAGAVSSLIAFRWRWAPLLGAVLYGLMLVASIPVIPPALSHPSDTYLFAFNVIFLSLATVPWGLAPARPSRTTPGRRPIALLLADSPLGWWG